MAIYIYLSPIQKTITVKTNTTKNITKVVLVFRPQLFTAALGKQIVSACGTWAFNGSFFLEYYKLSFLNVESFMINFATS